ncbi:type VII secretion-associated serine protease mycosin [Actinokineospora sp. G85]|uniref:type VII secretion-associated serine protease mycosin n=1 Tax=Actinokineospora sp. G85 TaxID=3406626 RepID=UPI003C73FD04
MSRKGITVALAAAFLAAASPSATAAPPEGACRDAEPAHPVVQELPWAQRLFDLASTWRHSTGAGVTVAVVDSGVDAEHPQLRGRVLPGRDFFLVGELRGDFDCGSHGTAAASIVVAAPAPGVGFRGVAPDARVLPVRITDRELNESGEPVPINPDAVAAGIRHAADQGAKVINLSLSGYGDFRAIREAVHHAQAKDALVVAAVGNRQESGSWPSFPAAYDGVLGVGSVDNAGARAQGSQVGDYVDLVAPGVDVLAATRVGGHDYWSGTSFAAPFVAGTAALVRAAHPRLTAPQVAERLLATAAPARGGPDSPEYGAGLVDPYRAVTERLSDRGPLALPVVAPPPVDPAAVREAAWWRDTGASAKLGAGLVAVVIAVAAVLAWMLPRGRRGRWAPRRAPGPRAARVREEQVPDEVFLFPRPPRSTPGRGSPHTGTGPGSPRAPPRLSSGADPGQTHPGDRHRALQRHHRLLDRGAERAEEVPALQHDTRDEVVGRLELLAGAVGQGRGHHAPGEALPGLVELVELGVGGVDGRGQGFQVRERGLDVVTHVNSWVEVRRGRRGSRTARPPSRRASP